jgi:hypothetical protein
LMLFLPSFAGAAPAEDHQGRVVALRLRRPRHLNAWGENFLKEHPDTISLD